MSALEWPCVEDEGFRIFLSPVIFQVAVGTQLFPECLVGVEPLRAVQTVLSPPPTLPSSQEQLEALPSSFWSPQWFVWCATAGGTRSIPSRTTRHFLSHPWPHLSAGVEEGVGTTTAPSQVTSSSHCALQTRPTAHTMRRLVGTTGTQSTSCRRCHLRAPLTSTTKYEDGRTALISACSAQTTPPHLLPKP